MATITTGHNAPTGFSSGETVTATKLNNHVNSATVTGIIDADISSGAAIDGSKLANSSVTPTKLSQPYTLATAQNSTSGTSIDFTGIPSWARRITVMLSGVSTNGTSEVVVRVGGGSIVSAGYVGSYGSFSTGSTGATLISSGFLVPGSIAGNLRHGQLIISNISGNSWVCSGHGGYSDSAALFVVSGTVSLSGALDRVSITTVNGTDTFDAGTVNIAYEG